MDEFLTIELKIDSIDFNISIAGNILNHFQSFRHIYNLSNVLHSIIFLFAKINSVFFF